MTSNHAASALKRRFISLEADPPPGFERVETIRRRDLRVGLVAIWTLDSEVLLASLEVAAENISGLLLCPDASGERTRLGSTLWRVGVREALLPVLREVADGWLDPCAELGVSLSQQRKLVIEQERERSDRQRLLDKVDQESKDLRRMLLARTQWTAEAMTSLVRFSAERLSGADSEALARLFVRYLTSEFLGYRDASIWRRGAEGWEKLSHDGDEVGLELAAGRSYETITQPDPTTLLVPIDVEGMDLLVVHTRTSFDEATRSFLSLCSLLLSAAVRARRLNDALERSLERKDVQIQELSAPIIQVGHDTVCLPVVGTLDRARASQIADSLLSAVAKSGFRSVIIDFTGLATMDADTVLGFADLAKAIGLLGAECMLSGISPRIAMAMVELDIEITDVATLCSVEAVIARQLGAAKGGHRKSA